MTEKLQFDLDVANNNLKKALTEAQNQIAILEKKSGNVNFDETADSLDKASKSAGLFGTGISTGLAAAAAGGALLISKITEVSETALRAYGEQETAIIRLNGALKSTGQFSESASADLQKFAGELQNTTRFSDDAALSAIGLLGSLTKLDSEGLKRATTAAANLSAQFGVDLTTATEAIARGINGQTKGLKNLGIQFKDTGDKGENFERIMAQVEAKFSGSAQKDLDTYAGKQANLANKTNELQESFGKLLINSGFIAEKNRILDNVLSKVGGTLERLNNIYEKDSIEKYNTRVKILTSDLKLLEQQRNIPGSQNDPVIAARIKNLNDEIVLNRALAEEELKRSNAKRADEQIAKIKSGPAPVVDDRSDEQIAKARQTQAEIEAIKDEQIIAESARQEQLSILQISGDEERAQAELDFIEQQSIAKAALKLEKQESENALIQDAEQRRLADKKANAEFELAVVQAQAQKEIAAKKSVITWETATNKQRVAQTQETLGLIAGLTASTNKTLFNIGKAAAISNATISGIEAVNKTLAFYPAPFGFPLAALVGAAAAVNVSKIAAQQPPAFEQGGIVPGNSFTGDRVNARVNSGELILNRAQQDNLVGQLGQDNRPIIVQIDGVAVFNAVRAQIQAGRKLA